MPVQELWDMRRIRLVRFHRRPLVRISHGTILTNSRRLANPRQRFSDAAVVSITDQRIFGITARTKF